MCRLLRPWIIFASSTVLALAQAGCELGERPLPYDTASRQRIDSGRHLLAQYQCGSCHSIPGVAAAQGLSAPSLAAFGRRSYIAGQHPNGPHNLARWIVEPAALEPSTSMPSMGVSAADARDMTAYLLSLK